MSVDFRWVVATFSAGEAASLVPLFSTALSRLRLDPSDETLRVWQANPDALLAEAAKDGLRAHRFNAIVLPPTIHDVCTRICRMLRDQDGFELTGDNTRYVAGNRVPPLAALAFGLGLDRVRELPGYMLSFCCAPSDVAEVSRSIDRIFTPPEQERAHVLARTRAWFKAFSMYNREEDVEGILSALPTMVRRAREGGHGLLSISGVC